MRSDKVTAEARFYCDENNYDVKKAKQAFDEDQAFEDHIDKLNK